MKTNIWLKCKHNDREDCCRVKLDSNKFPYIVIDNEKIVISSAKFPRTVSTVYGFFELQLEIVSGQSELESILKNPELTTDKMSLRQQMRLA